MTLRIFTPKSKSKAMPMKHLTEIYLNTNTNQRKARKWYSMCKA